MEPGPLRQPGPDLGVLVGAVVVHHQMDVQVLGHRRLDLAQEAQELLVSVAGLALGDLYRNSLYSLCARFKE